jgi:hypothetical protein
MIGPHSRRETDSSAAATVHPDHYPEDYPHGDHYPENLPSQPPARPLSDRQAAFGTGDHRSIPDGSANVALHIVTALPSWCGTTNTGFKLSRPAPAILPDGPGSNAMLPWTNYYGSLSGNFPHPRSAARDLSASGVCPRTLHLRRLEEITVPGMAQDFCPLARRERGTYPHGSVTSEQRSQRAKGPARPGTVISSKRLIR